MRAPKGPEVPLREASSVLAVLVTGLVLRLGDLTAVVEAAISADEVRALGFVALRALDGRDRLEFPIRRAPAPRLRARGFPFEICHVLFFLLRMRAAAGAVPFEATVGAQSPTVFAAHQHVG